MKPFDDKAAVAGNGSPSSCLTFHSRTDIERLLEMPAGQSMSGRCVAGAVLRAGGRNHDGGGPLTGIGYFT
jgi:hypothetical protein